MLKLVIANKNYSSWSLRPWLLLRQFEIPFTEIKLSLTDPHWAERVAAYSPAGRVPVLIDDELVVWESLAIIEYLAERLAEHAVWPRAQDARARARSLCAEMHAGFAALRQHWPMNVCADLPGHPGDAAVMRDVERMMAAWRAALADSGGPYLFGSFGAADAMFAPVVSRFATYHVTLDAPATAYCERILETVGMREWRAQAHTENEFIAADEPYRRAPSGP